MSCNIGRSPDPPEREAGGRDVHHHQVQQSRHHGAVAVEILGVVHRQQDLVGPEAICASGEALAVTMMMVAPSARDVGGVDQIAAAARLLKITAQSPPCSMVALINAHGRRCWQRC